MALTKNTPAWRLKILEEAEGSRNIAATCKRFGMDRTTFYKLRKRCVGLPRSEWLAALNDHPRRGAKHSQKTTARALHAILKLARKHPSWGCNQLAQALRQDGHERSHNTVQKILNRREMGTRLQRWLVLDQKDIELTAEQFEFVLGFNPSVRDAKLRHSRPGGLLFADTLPLGPFTKLGTLQLHVLIDSYSSHAFASIWDARSAKNALWLLEKRVLPYFKKRNIRVAEISTSKRIEFRTVYEQRLTQLTIKQVRRSNASSSGFIERFADELEVKFVNGDPCRDNVFPDLNGLREAFKLWLADYNSSPLEGFPTFGAAPYEVFHRAVRIAKPSVPMLSLPVKGS